MKSRIMAVGAALCAASVSSAFMGVGDVVIVASNPAQEILWATNELPKWVEMISKAEQQVNKAKEMVDVVGHPERFAAGIVDAALPGMQATELAKQLQSESAVLKATQDTWKLANELGDVKDGVLNVKNKYQVFGKDASRNRDRYVKLALEKALRARLREAIKNKRKVDREELALQQKTLAGLRSSQAQVQISLQQAALTASQQRVDLASAEVKQAETELLNFVGDADLEAKKELEEARERAETSASLAAQAVGDLEEAPLVRAPSGPPPSPRDWDPFQG